jgi:hypothetical protein
MAYRKKHGPFDPSFTFKLPAPLLKKLHDEADRRGTSASAIVRETLLDKYRNQTDGK